MFLVVSCSTQKDQSFSNKSLSLKRKFIGAKLLLLVGGHQLLPQLLTQLHSQLLPQLLPQLLTQLLSQLLPQLLPQ